MSTTLQLKRYVPASRNAHGNTAAGWADPVDWVVSWLAPGAMAEESTGDRDASIVAWTVSAPAESEVPGERDRVVVDGDEFEVVGRPKDWTRGPHRLARPGVIVELGRVNG